MSKPIWIGGDHASPELKAYLQKHLPDVAWKDIGPHGKDAVDYPDYAAKVAEAVSKGEADRGILICGSGIGVSIVANKFAGVRAALAHNEETARLSRMHNDANVLCLGARMLPPDLALEMVKVWLATPFSGEARHQARVDKISKFDRC